MPELKQTRGYQSRGAAVFGIVAELDVPNVRARVTFPDRTNLEGWWLKVGQKNTQNNKDFYMPDLGEQVVCLMDEDFENGVILCSIYSSVDTPPAGMTGDKRHVTFKDNATIEYDRSEHRLSHLAQDAASIFYDATSHELQVALPSGAFLTAIANGATFALDTAGNIQLKPLDGDIEIQTTEFTTSINAIITVINQLIALLATMVQSGSGVPGTPSPIT